MPRTAEDVLEFDKLRELLPEAAGLPVTRYELANLHAVNFVIEGLLGEGVAAAARFDPQAKALGEWLRSRYVDVPEELLATGEASRAGDAPAEDREQHSGDAP